MFCCIEVKHCDPCKQGVHLMSVFMFCCRSKQQEGTSRASHRPTMLDITVKTLDGKNRSFSVPDDVSYKNNFFLLELF